MQEESNVGEGTRSKDEIQHTEGEEMSMNVWQTLTVNTVRQQSSLSLKGTSSYFYFKVFTHLG